MRTAFVVVPDFITVPGLQFILRLNYAWSKFKNNIKSFDVIFTLKSPPKIRGISLKRSVVDSEKGIDWLDFYFSFTQDKRSYNSL